MIEISGQPIIEILSGVTLLFVSYLIKCQRETKQQVKALVNIAYQKHPKEATEQEL